MSEFDAFESAAPAQQEEDPAADFLAREQDQLAELEKDDFGLAATEQTSDAAPDMFSGGDTPQVASTVINEFDDMLGGFDGGSNTTSTDLFGGAPASGGNYDFLGTGSEVTQAPADSGAGLLADMSTPESGSGGGGLLGDDFGGAPPMDSVPQTSDPMSDFGGDMSGDMSGSQDAYSAISQVDTERAEPEKIRIWREEQKVMLEKKDEESEKKNAEWREIARQELADWYKHTEEQLEKTKKNNRDAEQAFISERDEKMPGHEWERICRLCEFNPKAARNTKDVARMRSILLQLKQTPLVR